MSRVWPGVVVTDDSLVQCVVEIRRELGDTGQRIIRTIPRRGYQLIADGADTPVDSPSAISRHHRKAIAALGLIAAVALLAWQFDVLGVHAVRHQTASDADGVVLAILPLRELNVQAGSMGPGGEGFAYLIAGELARHPDLHVVSTLVTSELRAKGMSVAQIGSATGARYVVDGSVERRGERLALEIHLVDAADAHIAWSGRFEPTAQELPGVAQTLLEQVSGSLGSAVHRLRTSAALGRAPASLDAHALALHGIALLEQRGSADGLRLARRELEQATRLDPGYPPAWAALGMVKTLLIASRSDDQLSEQDHPQAIADVRRAIALDPSIATSWRMLSFAIDSSKHAEEAVQAAEHAVELGPGDPDNWLALGLAQYYARRIDAALRNVEKAISWNRGLRPPLYALVDARLRYAVQDYEHALRSARDCMERLPAIVVCKAIWLSSQLRAGHAADAEAEWPRLVAAAPRLERYRYAPRGTPEAHAIDEDIERLRSGTGSARQ